MLYYLIVLRLFHICCGVFWAGVTIYLAAFVMPATKKAGPAGNRFMQQLSQTNRLPVVMTIVPTLAVLSGLLLIWTLSNGLCYAWVSSVHGQILMTGAIAAIIAYVIGFTVSRPSVMGLARVGKEMAGNPPTAEQAQTLARYGSNLTRATNGMAWLLALTVIAMSIMKYF